MRHALLAAALLALAGCGGGDDRHASFVAETDAICKRYETKIQALSQPRALPEVVPFIDQALPLMRRELAELRALEPPPEDRAQTRALVGGVERAVAELPRARAAAARNDAAATREALLRFGEHAGRARRAARALGAKECGGE